MLHLKPVVRCVLCGVSNKHCFLAFHAYSVLIFEASE